MQQLEGNTLKYLWIIMEYQVILISLFTQLPLSIFSSVSMYYFYY